MSNRGDKAARGQPNPYLVLATAALLPGFGHVLIGETRRGLTMQLFMFALAFVTWHLTTPEQSLVGRLSGGLFVYALSLPESYRLARLRRHAANAVTPSVVTDPLQPALGGRPH